MALSGSPSSPTTGSGSAVSAGNPNLPTDEERRVLSGIFKPIMGGIAILNKDDCSAFTGGVPKHNWSEFETPLNDYVSPIRGEYHPGCDCPARNSGLPSGIKSKFQTLSGFQIPCQISIHILD